MKPMVLISIIVILIGGIFGNYLRFNEQMPDQPPEFGLVPYTTDDYFGEEKRFSDLSYDILKADTTTLRRYVGSDGTFYWFETRSGSIREEFGMKWDLMKNSLMLQPTDAAFIRLTLQIDNGDVEQATNRAIEFFDNFYSDIKQGLPFNK